MAHLTSAPTAPISVSRRPDTLVTAQLAFCNTFYQKLPLKTLWKLELVQNTAAKVLTGPRPYTNMSCHCCPSYTGYQHVSKHNSRCLLSPLKPSTTWSQGILNVSPSPEDLVGQILCVLCHHLGFSRWWPWDCLLRCGSYCMEFPVIGGEQVTRFVAVFWCKLKACLFHQAFSDYYSLCHFKINNKGFGGSVCAGTMFPYPASNVEPLGCCLHGRMKGFRHL